MGDRGGEFKRSIASVVRVNLYNNWGRSLLKIVQKLTIIAIIESVKYIYAPPLLPPNWQGAGGRDKGKFFIKQLPSTAEKPVFSF